MPLIFLTNLRAAEQGSNKKPKPFLSQTLFFSGFQTGSEKGLIAQI
jgi:hypothetical protein